MTHYCLPLLPPPPPPPKVHGISTSLVCHVPSIGERCWCNVLGPALELWYLLPNFLLSNLYAAFSIVLNAKLPWRSASCCCGLSCVVPSPNIAPSPSPGLQKLENESKIESIFQSIVQSMVQSRVQLLHRPHCESCVQGIALIVQVVKIQLLDYPLPKSCL